MEINSEAIYATRPAETFGINGENQIRFTRNKDNTVIYIFSTNWPGNDAALSLAPYRSDKFNSTKISKITLLGNDETALKWSQNTTELSITMPSAAPMACKYCYVFKVYLDKGLTLPATPSNLTTHSGAKGITLKWVNNSATATGFTIERKDKNSNTFKKIASVNKVVTNFVDLRASSEANYVYRVCAFDAKGNSGYSNESTILVE